MNRLLWIICFLFAGAGTLFSQQSALTHRMVLIGDAGELDDGKIRSVELFKKLFRADDHTTILFLGDNVYPQGLPDEEERGYPAGKQVIDQEISIASGNESRMYFVPGNHDWAQGRSFGWDRVLSQQRYIDSLADPRIRFLPQGGCPGPEEVVVNERLVLIIMDSQWWLHRNEKPGLASDCDCKNEEEIVARLHDIVTDHPDKIIILAMHHPFYSDGVHGGYFSFKQHLFPLTGLNKSLYIPLPVIGSVYPLSRGLFGNIQDIRHPEYRNMINKMQGVIKGHGNIIHVAGHEHSLQYFFRDSTAYVVAGSGSKTTQLRKHPRSQFSDSENGFAVIDIYSTDSARISFYNEKSSSADEPAFSTLLHFSLPVNNPVLAQAPLFPDSMTVIGSKNFSAGGFKKFLLGANYRREWAQPVRVRVIDIGKELGGLVPDRRGGGHQTKSIRLKDSTGREYVLRSIEKYPTDEALPPDLRGTFVKDLVTDGVSASYPYAALSIPPLAAAAGVLHANPQLVYLPDDPRLKKFRSEFGNKFYLFEEREPDGVDRTYSTPKMMDKLAEDNDNEVDQSAFLQARLLDMFVMDFDRHEDQWRWAVTDQGKEKIFIPIPRDRDQPFFIRVGLFPYFASRSWVAPQLQGFRSRAENIRTFNFNGRNLDRALLNELDEQTWKKSTDQFLALVTDEIIDKAISMQPAEIKDFSAGQIARKLKERRRYFKQDMITYYRFLSRVVNITGSDKHEFFLVDTDSSGFLTVQVFKTSKEGEISNLLYTRRFDPRVTKEIRLYGLGGTDQFKVNNNNGTRIRIIGGPGEDAFEINQNHAASKVLLYDKADRENKITGSGRYRNKFSKDRVVNNYDWMGYRYNIRQPTISAAYNPDDGIFLGATMQWKRQGFHKDPYQSLHTLLGNHAFATRAFNFRYTGEFIRAIGRADLLVKADVKAPNTVINFFGFGNETVFDKTKPGKINFYRTRFNLADVELMVRRRVGTTFSIMAGPAFQYFSIDSLDNKTRFITQTNLNGLDPQTLFNRKTFLGGQLSAVVDTRNNKSIPARGFLWTNSIKILKGLNDVSRNVSLFRSDMSFYISFNRAANVVWAFRFGGGVSSGDFEFYQSQFLGGTDNLRGFRKNRFAGRSMLYSNVELRIKAADFSTYLFPGSIGFLFFNDVGRVWMPDESSRRWHQGFGAGLWISPLKRLVITISYTRSKDGGLPLISYGFQF